MAGRLLPLLLLISGLAVAHVQPKKVAASEEHRATPTPDRVILTWADDPARTQSVTWRTDASVTNALAQLALATDGPEFRKDAKDFPARTEPLQTDLGLAHYHSVTFTGLAPDTLYVYRVGDGENWSEWNQFRTAAAGVAPLEFIYLGDAQNDIFSLWSRVIRQAFREAPMARFLVHAGDLVNTGTSDADWGEWHRGGGWLNRSVPSIMAAGNHEYPKRVFTPHWKPQFTLPANGVPGLEESNYYLDIQGVRMVVLNTNERQKEQAEWLDQLLSNNPNQWTVITFHHPIFSTARGRDNKELRALLQPIFDKYRVDLVLTGHDHTYGRTNLVTGASARSAQGGTVYVVSVSGPKMYKIDRKPGMVRVAQDTQLYQVVRINGDRLEYRAMTARGILYDSFELRKRKGRANQLIDRMPKTPELIPAAPSSPTGGN
jgi:phosphodiesterase/alkaline phosphatase D-like protein